MTPVLTPELRTELVALCIDAQTDNSVQRRKLYDPSPAIDSIIEHACWLLRHAADEETRFHARAIVALAADTDASNRAERARVRELAGHIERPGPAKWSVRAVVRQTRDHLSVLLNPLSRPDAMDESMHAVLTVVREAPADVVGSHAHPNLTLRHELGAKKTTALWDLVDAAKGVKA